MGKQWLTLFFLGSKITADADCSHEIKRCLLLGRKVMIILESILKSRDYFANKGPSSQGYGFSSGHVWMWELDYEEGWAPKNWCFFWTVVLEKTLESLLQHRCSKASILQHSAFFTIPLSHPYMTTGKTIALTRQTFAGKVMCLLFNMLSRLVITFLPKSKCLLISWLQSASAEILEPRKIKSATVSTFPPFICHEMMELDAMILVFWMLS